MSVSLSFIKFSLIVQQDIVKCPASTVMGYWGYEIRRVFEGVEHNIVYSLLFLVCFWCSHETPVCAVGWVSCLQSCLM